MSILSFTEKAYRIAVPVGPTSNSNVNVKYEPRYARDGKGLPWILMTRLRPRHRPPSRNSLVPTANKASDVFMKNKVFVAVREKRTFRIVSPKNESTASSRVYPCPLPALEPRFKPPRPTFSCFLLFLLPPFTYAYDPGECIAVRARARSRTSYAAIRLRFATKAGCRKPTGDILPPFFPSRLLFLPLNLIPVSSR